MLAREMLANERLGNSILTNESGAAAVRGLGSLAEVIPDQILCH